MPVIIDANRASDFTEFTSGHANLILALAKDRRTKICVGGKLLRELAATKVRILIQEWARTGVLLRIQDNLVDAEEKVVVGLPIKSDDPHVVALARLSGCNVIYTEDTDLIKDLKNTQIALHRRKVVTTRTHAKIAISILTKFGCP